MTLSFGQWLTIGCILVQVGIIIGGLMFDQFVSRPTLRLVNEELKRYQNLLAQAMEHLQRKQFQEANKQRIKQDDNLGNHK